MSAAAVKSDSNTPNMDAGTRADPISAIIQVPSNTVSLKVAHSLKIRLNCNYCTGKQRDSGTLQDGVFKCSGCERTEWREAVGMYGPF